MHTYNVEVVVSHVGPDCLMRPYEIVRIMQDASLQWLNTEPTMHAWMKENDILMVVTSRQVDILRQPKLDEKLQVRTSVYNYRSFLGYRNTCVYDEQGQPVAQCWCMGAWVDTNTGKATRVPQQVVDSLVMDDEVPMEKLSHKVKPPACAPVEAPAFTVRRSETDLYGHVNNMRYVRMAWELLPEDFTVHRMRIEHKGQALPGEVIAPLVYTEDGKCTVALNAADGSLFTIVEFS